MNSVDANNCLVVKAELEVSIIDLLCQLSNHEDESCSDTTVLTREQVRWVCDLCLLQKQAWAMHQGCPGQDP